MKVIILAGGFATRLWPLTEKTAKPLVPLAGKPLISWIVAALPEHFEIVVSTNAVFAADFEKWKCESFPTRAIEIFVEDAQSETGKKGALFATSLVIQEKKLREDILLIAGDNYFGFSFADFLQRIEAAPQDLLLAVYDVKNIEKARSFGVVVPDSKKPDIVEAFQEKPEKPHSTLVATGCFFFPKKILSELCAFAATSRDDLGKVFEHFLKQGNAVRCFAFAEPWFDIGSFAAYLEANLLLINHRVVREKDVRIAPDAKLSGSIFLGAGTQIGSNVTIENAVIFPGCRLENCNVRNTVIGKNAVISGVDLNAKVIRDESFLLR